MQVQQLVQQVHPGMEVVGSNYPVTATRALAAQALVVVQMALLALVFLGDQAFQALGVAPPAVYDKVKQNKFGAAMAVWFLGNMLHSSLTTTGAFEVFYNGQLLFSKLAAKRLPMREELLHALEDAIQQHLNATAAVST